MRDAINVPHLAIRKDIATKAFHKLMNFHHGNAAFLVDDLKWFHVRIKLLPLTGPVGPDLFFPDDTPAFRCLGPADVLTHERQGAVDIPTIEGRVGLNDQRLCVRHESSRVHTCTLHIASNDTLEQLTTIAAACASFGPERRSIEDMRDVPETIEAVWKIESTRLIAGIARVTRDIGIAEKLAQDALVTALEVWPEEGIPENPGAWLMTAAKRRAIDSLRRGRMLVQKHDEITRELEHQQRRLAEELEQSFLIFSGRKTCNRS